MYRFLMLQPLVRTYSCGRQMVAMAIRSVATRLYLSLGNLERAN
jgi:hypothetical protein